MASRMELTPADFGLLEGGTAKMRALADVILAEWGAEARAVLKTSLSSYLKSLAIRHVDATSCSVELPGQGVPFKVARMALMQELGMGPGGIGTEGRYDIRRFVLRGSTRKLKWGSTGPYVNVPFDHSKASIARMGGRAASAAASGLARGVSLGAGHAPRLKPGHVSDPLQGMRRRQSTYSRSGASTTDTQTSGFRTWRRMSWAGKAWMHPGIKAKRLGDRVRAALPMLIDQVF